MQIPFSNKRPANAKVTVRGSLSTNAPESEHITIKRFMCRVCLNEERRAMLKAQVFIFFLKKIRFEIIILMCKYF